MYMDDLPLVGMKEGVNRKRSEGMLWSVSEGTEEGEKKHNSLCRRTWLKGKRWGARIVNLNEVLYPSIVVCAQKIWKFVSVS